MIASAPGKLIVTGEYAVLEGAPALVIAVDRRAVARRSAMPPSSSPFLLAVAGEIAARRGPADPAARAAREISVDSAAFYDGNTKLGLGSSAAVTVAATALALGKTNPAEILDIALAAHARAQGARGARGSGADIAASVHGGTIVFSREASSGGSAPRHIEHRRWPASVAILPFGTGVAADTAELVTRVQAARDANRTAVDAALGAIADASRATCAALAAPPDLAPGVMLGGLALAASAMDQLARASGIDLVPACVSRACTQLARLGGTAKTTGAGGGDVGIAVFPRAVDATVVTGLLIEAGCQPLQISIDQTGVDVRADPS